MFAGRCTESAEGSRELCCKYPTLLLLSIGVSVRPGVARSPMNLVHISRAIGLSPFRVGLTMAHVPEGEIRYGGGA